MPQGREIFPLLTVEENLQTGFGAAAARQRSGIPDQIFELFPVLKTMLRRRAATSRAASSSSWRSAAR